MKNFLKELFCRHKFETFNLSYVEYCMYKPIFSRINENLLIKCKKCGKNYRKDIDKALAYYQLEKGLTTTINSI